MNVRRAVGCGSCYVKMLKVGCGATETPMFRWSGRKGCIKKEGKNVPLITYQGNQIVKCQVRSGGQVSLIRERM